MKESDEVTPAQKEFLLEVYHALEDIDFQYQRYEGRPSYDLERSKHYQVVDKIKGLEDPNLKSLAIDLYNLLVLKNGNRLKVDW